MTKYLINSALILANLGWAMMDGNALSVVNWTVVGVLAVLQVVYCVADLRDLHKTVKG